MKGCNNSMKFIDLRSLWSSNKTSNKTRMKDYTTVGRWHKAPAVSTVIEEMQNGVV